jgi:MoaA/NifB/PqqE/SkfB family radical SAM enzyme
MSRLSPAQLTNYLKSKWIPKSPVCRNEPVMICLFVTNRCTLSCRWCLRQTGPVADAGRRPDMTFEQVKRVFSYFPSTTHLSLAGFGEPLLVENLFKVIREATGRPMRTRIITNGTLLLERIDEIVRAKLEQISISVNSLTASDYMSACGGSASTFSNVLRGIQLLAEKRRSRKPTLHLSFVLTRDLFNRTREIIKFAEEARVDHLDLHNLIAYSGTEDYNGMLTDDDSEVISRLQEWKKQTFRVNVGWPKLVRKGLQMPERICGPLWDWLGVDMDGNTAGCSKAMPAKSGYGNLFEEGSGVWNNGFRRKLRAAFLNREFLFESCKSCTVVQP